MSQSQEVEIALPIPKLYGHLISTSFLQEIKREYLSQHHVTIGTCPTQEGLMLSGYL